MNEFDLYVVYGWAMYEGEFFQYFSVRVSWYLIGYHSKFLIINHDFNVMIYDTPRCTDQEGWKRVMVKFQKSEAQIPQIINNFPSFLALHNRSPSPNKIRRKRRKSQLSGPSAIGAASGKQNYTLCRFLFRFRPNVYDVPFGGFQNWRNSIGRNRRNTRQLHATFS